MVKWLFVVTVALVTLVAAPPTAAHNSPAGHPAPSAVTCAEQASVLTCDSDRDGVVDVVEEAICGSATCATGTEDLDGNGVADATELAESLKTGGPGGPVQLESPSQLIIVGPDGSITEISLWLVAAASAALLVVAGCVVWFLRRARDARSVRSTGRRMAEG